jgi:hypothetical protein
VLFGGLGRRAVRRVCLLDTAHYLVTKHSQKSRLMASVAVTARVYSSRAFEYVLAGIFERV